MKKSLALLLVLGLSPLPAAAQGAQFPYRVTISTPRTTIAEGQEIEIKVTLENAGDKPGPIIKRSQLAGDKCLLAASTRALDSGEKWKGSWVPPLNKPVEGNIGPLMPGEQFVTSMRVKFAADLFEDHFPFYVEWYAPTGPMKDFRSNQLQIHPQNLANPLATLTTNKGIIVMELWPEMAPNHVANFIHLARSGFYNDKVFHRVIPNFMIQTGCPEGTGRGGPGYNIGAEFNDSDFKKGVLGMARSGEPNSAGSQFFICVADAPHLNKQYTAFGRVLEGQEIADEISRVHTDRDRPVQTVELKRVEVALPKAYTLPEVKKN